jgi:hypothetical protein
VPHRLHTTASSAGDDDNHIIGSIQRKRSSILEHRQCHSAHCLLCTFGMISRQIQMQHMTNCSACYCHFNIGVSSRVTRHEGHNRCAMIIRAQRRSIDRLHLRNRIPSTKENQQPVHFASIKQNQQPVDL